MHVWFAASKRLLVNLSGTLQRSFSRLQGEHGLQSSNALGPWEELRAAQTPIESCRAEEHGREDDERGRA
eukprot:6759067-Pyramimonas_sp.AAC.1